MVEPARKILADRYELRALLAAGGMGQVWRAHDQLLGRPVAVKVLRSEYTGDELFLARFRAEAQHAAALGHPNIAAVYDYGEEPAIDGSGEHLAYLVMELVEGESLSSLLARGGALTPDRTLDLLRQTAAALAVAHEAGVVHRDVKPGNVLVRWDGTVKITDFGIAWSAGSVPLTQTGQVIGTASYLSPEQAAGAHATPASDVYALGMVGYECLAGRRAFDGDNSVTIALRHLRDTPDPLPDEVPAGIRTLIEHALVKDPAQRYPDGAAFVAAVDEVLAGRQLPPVQRTDTQSFWLLPDAAALAGAAPATGETRRPPRPAPQGRVGRLLVPLVALLVGAGLAAGVLQALTPTAPPATTASTLQVTASPAADELVLERADYVGRPVDAVRIQLEAMDLQVQLEAVETDEVSPGTVVDVAPLSVRLQPGQTVLVSYAAAAEPRSSSAGGSSRAPAEAVVQSPEKATPSASPTPRATTSTPTPSPTATPTPTVTTEPVETEPVETDEPDEDDDDDEDGGTPVTTAPTTTATPTSTAATTLR
ncbi:serine/threonine-protein kinase [Modestobacter versicolor]|uniref:non-specific serine/threonine protein kinase n=1 Tax=Modestobacter versicolor TaxID=429133 RepID=A0A839YC21_9ACTN|nr:serine/threonine-protein kinase [Modestobacter versicolor]